MARRAAGAPADRGSALIRWLALLLALAGPASAHCEGVVLWTAHDLSAKPEIVSWDVMVCGHTVEGVKTCYGGFVPATAPEYHIACYPLVNSVALRILKMQGFTTYTYEARGHTAAGGVQRWGDPSDPVPIP